MYQQFDFPLRKIEFLKNVATLHKPFLSSPLFSSSFFSLSPPPHYTLIPSSPPKIPTSSFHLFYSSPLSPPYYVLCAMCYVLKPLNSPPRRYMLTGPPLERTLRKSLLEIFTVFTVFIFFFRFCARLLLLIRAAKSLIMVVVVVMVVMVITLITVVTVFI